MTFTNSNWQIGHGFSVLEIFFPNDTLIVFEYSEEWRCDALIMKGVINTAR